jgi:hypothetical protein
MMEPSILLIDSPHEIFDWSIEREQIDDAGQPTYTKAEKEDPQDTNMLGVGYCLTPSF